MREKWSSRSAFIQAAIGSAVVLGNAWRFPGLAAKYGGGAFLFVYLISMLVIGIPLLMMEISVARYTRQGAPGSMRALNKKAEPRGIQVGILGTGDKDYEDSFKYFDWKYGDMMAARIEYDPQLAHRIFAGADIYLMPSEFEPCGQSQMIAQHYGTLPVVRETGGLRDAVEAYNQFTNEGTGFLFKNMSADDMAMCLLSAAEVYKNNKESWSQLQKNAMERDFSWDNAAASYIELFESLVQ